MINVDLKALLERLNPYCTRSLEAAAGLCVSRTHYEVTVEHVLLKLLESPQSDFSLILHDFGLDTGTVEKRLIQAIESYQTGNSAKPVFSPLLMEWYQDAWLIASIDLAENQIRSGALLLAFLKRSGRYATDVYAQLLDQIQHTVLLSRFGEIVKNSVEQPSPSETQREEKPVTGDGTALGRFCENFTDKAEKGQIDPVFGRDREIRQMIDILARRRKNNPIVVGEAGVGKTAVVEGLALRIVEGDVPDILRNVMILGLDMGLLQAGAGVKGEFENRLKSVINEIKASPRPIILFIDEAHTLIGAGAAAGSGDAANLLKPALARGELRTVAATTWSEYKKYFEKDAALARRFQLVKLDEPSEETAILILRGLKQKYEETHGVDVRDDAIVAAAEMASRYISGRQLPDKAVDLLDTSAARVRILLTAKPDVIEDRERTHQALERERQALERDRENGMVVDEARIAEIAARLEALDAELNGLKERWETERNLADKICQLRKERREKADAEGAAALETEMEAAARELETIQGASPLVRVEVDPDVVAQVVSDWTSIPLGKVMRDEARNVLHLQSELSQRIKGQEPAMEAIGQGIRAARAGLKDPDQPMGIFLLVGPSGVGKTETALAVADLLFGGERFMVSINMSEFQEKHTVSRLIGSPPGYVGFGEGGILTEAVRQRPYSVVLLDEVEKADLEVMNLFYQVFDKGVLSDGEGRVIDFRNTVLFLTSNLASDVITEMSSDGEKPPLEALTAAIRPILSNHFKPALLARMSVVPFCTLDQEIMKEIVILKLEKLVRRVAQAHQTKLVYSTAVADQIAERCIEVETGARNIDHIMNGTILPLMSREILSRMGEGTLPSEIRLDMKEEGTFTVEFGG